MKKQNTPQKQETNMIMALAFSQWILPYASKEEQLLFATFHNNIKVKFIS